MDQQTKDYLLIGIAAAFTLYFLWTSVGKPIIDKFNSERESDRSVNVRLADASERLADELVKANSLDRSEDIKSLLAGLVRVCEAHVAEVQKHREAVAVFTKLVVREPEEVGGDKVEQYDEYEADRAFAKGQYTAEGYTSAEAEHRVDADEAARIYSAATPGVD